MVKNKNNNLSYELLTTPLLSETVTISKTLNQNHLNLFPKYPETATFFQVKARLLGTDFSHHQLESFCWRRFLVPKSTYEWQNQCRSPSLQRTTHHPHHGYYKLQVNTTLWDLISLLRKLDTRLFTYDLASIAWSKLMLPYIFCIIS